MKKLWKEVKILNKINKKIDAHKIIERKNYHKKTEAEIFNETKALEEIETKSRELEIKLTKKKVLKWYWWARNKEKTNNENRDRENNKVNKIQGHKIII